MPHRKKLTDEQRVESENLRRIWDERSDKIGLTQAAASKEFGFANQSAVSQYLNARIPLNTETALRFAKLLGVPVKEISPRTGVLVETDHDVKRKRLGIPLNDDLLEVDSEMKKIVGDCNFLVIDKDAASIDSGVFLVAIGGNEVLVEISPSEGGYTLRGASDKPMQIPHQALQLIAIKGKVTHKIYKC